MNIYKWFLGVVALGIAVILILLRPFSALIYPELPYIDFYSRALYILLLGCLFCLYRIVRGPTGADRIVAVDILGVLIVGFCAILTISTGRSWYMDIAIAWILQSFVSTLALAKYMEGKGLDE